MMICVGCDVFGTGIDIVPPLTSTRLSRLVRVFIFRKEESLQLSLASKFINRCSLLLDTTTLSFKCNLNHQRTLMTQSRMVNMETYRGTLTHSFPGDDLSVTKSISCSSFGRRLRTKRERMSTRQYSPTH